MDVSELAKLDPEKLEKIQSVLALFHLFGLSDEEISRLPQVLKNWPIVVKNLNDMGQDLFLVKKSIMGKNASGANPEIDSEDSLRKMVGFDSHVENVVFNEGGNDNGGKK